MQNPKDLDLVITGTAVSLERLANLLGGRLTDTEVIDVIRQVGESRAETVDSTFKEDLLTLAQALTEVPAEEPTP